VGEAGGIQPPAEAPEAALFLGEYQHALDPKGRVILPASFRPELEEGLIMTIGHDRCLTIHPASGWEVVLRELRKLRPTDERARSYARVMTASAQPETLDRQGRVTIPARLRNYAGLTRDCTVVGGDQHVEIWDTAAWERYRDAALAEFATTDRPFDVGGIF
jgi:MraZ protein